MNGESRAAEADPANTTTPIDGSDFSRRRPFRASCGLRADGFREGHQYGRRDACRRLWMHLNAEGRAMATGIVAEGEAVA